MDLERITDKIIKRAEAIGYMVDEYWAKTGTRYLECKYYFDDNVDKDIVTVKIRVADHGECYCSEDISVDPNGCTVDQAIRLLAKRAGIDLEQHEKTLRSERAKRAAKTRKRNKENPPEPTPAWIKEKIKKAKKKLANRYN